MVHEFRIFNLFIPQSQSLKQKRRVVNSIKDKIRSRFNASVIEISGNDVWQRADIAIALLSNSRVLADKELDKIRILMESGGETLVTNVTSEIP